MQKQELMPAYMASALEATQHTRFEDIRSKIMFLKALLPAIKKQPELVNKHLAASIEKLASEKAIIKTLRLAARQTLPTIHTILDRQAEDAGAWNFLQIPICQPSISQVIQDSWREIYARFKGARQGRRALNKSTQALRTVGGISVIYSPTSALAKSSALKA